MMKHVRRFLVLAVILGGFGLMEPIVPGTGMVDEVLASPAGDLDDEVSVHLQPDRLPMRGNPNAIVTVVEFTDYQCPFCGRAENTMKELLDAYPNEVRIVIAPMPLPFHPNAMPAAKAAYAAFLQGRFWEMHDLLFENQKELSESYYIEAAKSLGLNVPKFKQDYHDQKAQDFIDKSIKDAGALGIKGTPTFLVNGEVVTGAQPLSRFKEVVDGAIERVQTYRSQNKDTLPDSELSGAALYEAMVKSVPKLVPENTADANDNNNESRVYIEDGKSPVLGKSNAPITIMAYMDFQCPFSKRAAKTMKELMADNPDKIRIVFKHYPLPFHDKAALAHQAAEAARNQKKFWEYYDLLFEHQDALTRHDLIEYARQLHLNEKKFIKDMDSEKVISVIDKDKKIDVVKGTPNFFVNGKIVTGAQPLDVLQKAVDNEVAFIKKYKESNNKYKKLTGQKLYQQILKDQSEQPSPYNDINLDGAPSMGPDNAPVTIVEYSDFQCPFCSRASATMRQIMTSPKYKNKLRLVFKQLPLAFHNNAQKAAEAALFAHKYNKFWEMHDLLFDNQRELSEADLLNYAEAIGLSRSRLELALESGEFAEAVSNDLKEANNMGLSGTPSFVINGKLVVGAQPQEKFEIVIDEALDNSKNKKDKKSGKSKK